MRILNVRNLNEKMHYQMKKQLNHKIQVIKIIYILKLNKQLRTSQIIVSE